MTSLYLVPCYKRAYHNKILLYFVFLADCEGRLREVCSELLGPFFRGDQDGEGWQANILVSERPKNQPTKSSDRQANKQTNKQRDKQSK